MCWSAVFTSGLRFYCVYLGLDLHDAGESTEREPGGEFKLAVEDKEEELINGIHCGMLSDDAFGFFSTLFAERA